MKERRLTFKFQNCLLCFKEDGSIGQNAFREEKLCIREIG